MKNKLLKLFFGQTTSRRGRQGVFQADSSNWMKEQIRRMNSLNQEIISVKAVKG